MSIRYGFIFLPVLTSVLTLEENMCLIIVTPNKSQNSLSSKDHIEGKVKYGESTDYVGLDFYIKNRIDYGLQINGGIVLFKKIALGVCYQSGLNKFDPDLIYGKNKSLLFSIGVPLQLKKKTVN